MNHYSATNITLIPLWQGIPLGDTLGLLVIISFIVVCLISAVLAIILLFPRFVEGSKGILLQSPWRAFFVGLVNYIFLGGIALLAFSAGVDFLGLIGLIILAFLSAITAVGLGGLVLLTGERLSSRHSKPLSALAESAWGALLLTLAGVLPFIGWFLLAPLMCITAFGAAVLGWRNRKQDEY